MIQTCCCSYAIAEKAPSMFTHTHTRTHARTHARTHTHTHTHRAVTRNSGPCAIHLLWGPLKITFGVMVIGPSIGINKWINKTGQNNRYYSIHDKCNKLNKAFLSHRKALDSKALILSKTAGKLLLINSVIISSPSCHSKWLSSVEHKITFCRMLPNHLSYPWFLLYGQK